MEHMERLWEHVRCWSCSIEVNYQPKEEKGILTRVYFPYDPKVSFNVKLQYVLQNHLLLNHTFANSLIWKTSVNCVSDLSRHDKCLLK